MGTERADPLPFPIYGFVEGDTVGVLVFADEIETVSSLMRKLLDAVELRVKTKDRFEAVYQGNVLDPAAVLDQTPLKPLQRLDLRRSHEVPKGGHDR